MAQGSPGLIERLNSIPLHTVKEKQRLIARAAPALQYSLLEDGYALQDDAFGRVIRQLQQQTDS